MNSYIAESRKIRCALTDASRALRQAMGDDLWDHDDLVDVMDVIWTAWVRRGNAMREVDPNCYSISVV